MLFTCNGRAKKTAKNNHMVIIVIKAEKLTPANHSAAMSIITYIYWNINSDDNEQLCTHA